MRMFRSPVRGVLSTLTILVLALSFTSGCSSKSRSGEMTNDRNTESEAAPPPSSSNSNDKPDPASDADLVEAAKAEGSLTVYSTIGEDKMTKWVAGFEDKYGIDVTVFRQPGGPLVERFMTENDAGKNTADVLNLDSKQYYQIANDAGYVASYEPVGHEKYPSSLIIPERAYPVALSVASIAWNVNKVPDDLQQKFMSAPLDALLDPRLKGHIAVVDVSAGGSQVYNWGNIILNQSEKFGWDYAEMLAKQDPAIVNSAVSLADQIASGQYWATTDGYETIYGTAIVDKNAPMKINSATPTSVTPFYLGIAGEAPHPQAARLFMNWALSEDGQALMAQVNGSLSPMDGWTDNRPIKDLDWYSTPANLWLDGPNDDRLTGEALAEFQDKWHSVLGSLK